MNSTIPELAERLETAQTQLLDALDGATDRELYTTPSEDEWTVAQVCAHVAELQPLWMGKIAAMDSEPTVARSEADAAARAAAITDHASDPLAMIVERLGDANSQALELLRGMSSTDLERRSSLGKTATELIESHVIDHVEAHARQIGETRRSV